MNKQLEIIFQYQMFICSCLDIGSQIKGSTICQQQMNLPWFSKMKMENHHLKEISESILAFQSAALIILFLSVFWVQTWILWYMQLFIHIVKLASKQIWCLINSLDLLKVYEKAYQYFSIKWHKLLFGVMNSTLFCMEGPFTQKWVIYSCLHVEANNLNFVRQH